MPVWVVTERGRVNLRDLRDSMQRKLHPTRDYDFLCATFLGFPIDYCILHISRPDGARQWLDVVGPITISHELSRSRTLSVEVSTPAGLCAHSGTGQSSRYEAMYFARLCFSYTKLDGVIAYHCVSGADAVVVQQLYETQWGMLSCCSGDKDRLMRILNRITVNAINGN